MPAMNGVIVGYSAKPWQILKIHSMHAYVMAFKLGYNYSLSYSYIKISIEEYILRGIPLIDAIMGQKHLLDPLNSSTPSKLKSK